MRHRYASSHDILVGTIGYGGAYNMGRKHLTEMQRAGMVPTAVCEIDPERLQVAAADFPGIETYRSVAALLARSQAGLLAVITPPSSHARIARQCLAAGRHVVCEKPMAITTAECDAMIAAARKRRLLLSTYHNRHWDGPLLRARQVVASGAIGEVVRIALSSGERTRPPDRWRSRRSLAGGILYDWGVHLLEQALQLIEAPVTEVAGFAKRGFWAPQTAGKDDAIEDEATAIVRFASGQWLSLCVSAIDSNPRKPWVVITGTKGSYQWEQAAWEQFVVQDGTTTVTSGRNPESEDWRFYQNIADHLVGDAELAITPQWSRRLIHILELAARSAAQGRALRPDRG